MAFVHVKHNKSIFTRALRRKPRKGASSLAGTQQIDRVWMHVKASIPKGMHNKKSDGCHREANADRIWKYIRQFQFRRMHTDVFTALSKLCQAANRCS